MGKTTGGNPSKAGEVKIGKFQYQNPTLSKKGKSEENDPPSRVRSRGLQLEKNTEDVSKGRRAPSHAAPGQIHSKGLRGVQGLVKILHKD